MELKITGRHLEITPAINDYASRKCARFDRYFDRIQSIEVVIDKLGQSFEVEVIVDVEHHDSFIAKAKDEDLYACIDSVSDKIERQLTDHKEKLRNRKHVK
ncbi:ribosome-associated translation inhibitor RaiA [Planctomycetales bacterium ZRK34]|nr:ribosome-associated translation inhibitor RaiA [Planctomycetales bacterium ZRK34]